MSKYHIVFPRSDKSTLAVVEICDGLEYELSDYSVASRQNFDDKDSAVIYARELAKKNGLHFSYPDGSYLD